MDASRLEHMKNKYRLLYHVENAAIDRKVDKIFADLIGRNKSILADLLFDAREKGKV